jgi:hypothetical protein
MIDKYDTIWDWRLDVAEFINLSEAMNMNNESKNDVSSD